jgi:hypothetical protein
VILYHPLTTASRMAVDTNEIRHTRPGEYLVCAQASLGGLRMGRKQDALSVLNLLLMFTNAHPYGALTQEESRHHD